MRSSPPPRLHAPLGQTFTTGLLGQKPTQALAPIRQNRLRFTDPLAVGDYRRIPKAIRSPIDLA